MAYLDKHPLANEGHRRKKDPEGRRIPHGPRIGDVMQVSRPMEFVGRKFENYDSLKDPDNYVDMFFNAWGAQYAGKGPTDELDESAYWLENAAFQVHQQQRKHTVTVFPILSCHDHLVTSLPEKTLRAVVKAAAPVRYHVWERAVAPTEDAWMAFCQQLPTVQAELEEDLARVVVKVLNCKRYATTLALSVPDRKVVPVHRGFKPPASAGGLQNAIDSLTPTPLQCYWCLRSGANVKLTLCGSCQQIDYCSRECQKADWKSYHKAECKGLKNSTKLRQGLKPTRVETVMPMVDAGQHPVFGLPLVRPGDATEGCPACGQGRMLGITRAGQHFSDSGDSLADMPLIPVGAWHLMPRGAARTLDGKRCAQCHRDLED